MSASILGMQTNTKPSSTQWPASIYIFMGTFSENLGDANRQLLLSTEHGKSDDVQLLQKTLQICDPKTKVEIIPIAIETQQQIINQLAQKRASGEHMLVINLCDGTELDGYPGISVVKNLQNANIPFSGADAHFYDGTTSKPALKRQLIKFNVETSPFQEINPGTELADIAASEKILSWPMIIKPSVSYASMNISDTSIVHSKEEALCQIEKLCQLTSQGIFIEKFLPGREFTALCTGDSRDGVKVYPVAERVFNPALKTEERILAFDRYWDGYELGSEAPAMTESSMVWYDLAPSEWQSHLQDLARRAYTACGGNGYGRVDIRTQSFDKPDALVLEVNANCGLAFGDGASSLGEILKLSKISPRDFCMDLVRYSFARPV
ncbi:hypothetical protein BATDEDRAFT_33473 [Batrachochytrium dendrobatidis JAM81]|uniref:ATP-grasp domain-containing protein n=1 Tax=Batrachochytrium dendrobatidis (strain JAM81 / FGSC 10211) TaxID=684364 RepID=F4P7E7_BATDJ|nr:uncharacterized protein BATDEDRAFT_33473 [Batrachochytrium dendrobatidis JAM81]EGF78901.1 hypothetical protein BATDEDRAFT_33473 [Batrachochytrium dendrobatidis JAM81]KAK5667354.1 hypothetical protein QVD99_005960 [Batrachochytrium dendrobatidis]|eukprot:XP_006680390.1 hypothetical protein BATDEDRAFT_33473 [Batrachochytrium dendrobatidis JAM81]